MQRKVPRAAKEWQCPWVAMGNAGTFCMGFAAAGCPLYASDVLKGLASLIIHLCIHTPTSSPWLCCAGSGLGLAFPGGKGMEGTQAGGLSCGLKDPAEPRELFLAQNCESGYGVGIGTGQPLWSRTQRCPSCQSRHQQLPSLPLPPPPAPPQARLQEARVASFLSAGGYPTTMGRACPRRGTQWRLAEGSPGPEDRVGPRPSTVPYLLWDQGGCSLF